MYTQSILVAFVYTQNVHSIGIWLCAKLKSKLSSFCVYTKMYTGSQSGKVLFVYTQIVLGSGDKIQKQTFSQIEAGILFENGRL